MSIAGNIKTKIMGAELLINKRSEISMLKAMKDNPKYELIVLLMLDCGMRVTEVTRLRTENIDVAKSMFSIPSLKKRSEKPVYRDIPMTYRVKESLASYMYNKTFKNGFVFPTNSATGHITRISIYKTLKRRTDYQIRPHMLRHTFATKIVNSTDDLTLTQHLLGHSNRATTEAYVHTPFKKKIDAIRSIEKINLVEKFRRLIVKPKRIRRLSIDKIPSNLSVGRKSDVMKLQSFSDRKINVYLSGRMGVGKSHLLDRIQGEKVLRLDNFKSLKKTLGNILLHLYNGDKAKILQLLTDGASIDRILTRESSVRLVDLMIKSTEPMEYTLVIDDLTNVTKSGVTVLEKLKTHFHMVVAARSIKIVYGTFLSNFEKIEVKSLTRSESMKLIFLLSSHMMDRIENYESYKTMIYDKSDGVPLHIYELVERFSKEQIITVDDISLITTIQNQKTFDFSLPILIALSSLMVLRYVGGELGDDSGAYKLFGGMFLVFALFARNLFAIGKRKYI